MAGWSGVATLECIDERGEAADVDVRYAWGSEIWKQNRIDCGASATTLQPRPQRKLRSKRIIYLCEPSTDVAESLRSDTTPVEFLLGSYWSSIEHLYIRLPFEHPFQLPRNRERHAGYATTRRGAGAPNETVPSRQTKHREGGLRTRGISKAASGSEPLISVIITVRNGAPLVEQAIQSVINQSYDNVELIVIDGGSVDDTVDVLAAYDRQIDYWVSEPDTGIYCAMNKGLAVANGYIFHLGSDDVLLPNVLAPVAARLSPSSLVITNVVSGKSLVRSAFDWKMRFQNRLHHQSVFYPPAVKPWGYPEEYRICADYALNLRLYNAGFPATYIDQVTAFCRKTGISHADYFAAHREISAIRRKLSPRAHFLFDPVFTLRYKAKHCFKIRMD